MCIIAAKPKGIAMPDRETIRNMWCNNPDGAGIMYAQNGKVCIDKGHMKLKDFLAALDRIEKSTDLTNTGVVMHFRIATHGGVNAENTHPFPITDCVGKLKKPKQTVPLGVAHNGIINVIPRKGISDTMEYIAGQLAPLARAVPNFYRNPDLLTMIKNATESKLAFLNGKGEIVTVGIFNEEDGISYSNYSYSYNRSWRSAPITEWDSVTGKWIRKTTPYLPYASSQYDTTGGYLDDATDNEDYLAALRAAEDDDLSTPPPVDLDDCEYIPLMPLDEEAGEYVRSSKGILYTGDYFIDAEDHVYKYSFLYDACVPCDGWTAHNAENMSLRFEDTLADNELIFLNVPPSYFPQ